MGAKRPAYFQADGTMPEEATLTITRPPAWLHLSDEAFSEKVRELCVAREKEIHRKLKKEKRWFAGRRAILRLSHLQTPQSRGGKSKLSPRVASKDRVKRRWGLETLGLFLEEYACTRLLWKKGMRDAVFPPGTFAMHMYFGAPRAPCI